MDVFGRGERRFEGDWEVVGGEEGVDGGNHRLLVGRLIVEV